MLRIALYGTFACAFIALIVVTADALVTTDTERLEAIVDAMTDGRASDRIESVINLVEPSHTPVELVESGNIRRFSSSGDARMSSALRDALSPLKSGDCTLVQSHVSVHGDDAEVAVRFRTSHGLNNAVLQLSRDGDRWLARRIVVSRG